MPPTADPILLQGTLDLLVLKTLSWGPRHGYAIARWIRDTSDETFSIDLTNRVNASIADAQSIVTIKNN